MRNIVVILISVSLIIATLVNSESGQQDTFELIKVELAQAACVKFEILTKIESSVFNDVDSAQGSAVIAADGRFNVVIGSDQYLYDSKHLYTYSKINNQVIVETPNDSGVIVGEISFITNIDKWYSTQVVDKNSKYRLLLKNSSLAGMDMPDSMTVYVTESSRSFDSLAFFDINEDRNVIQFLCQILVSVCTEELFEPSFPDSVDIVRF
ncbi:MAG: hypothetical protein DRP47_05985 [Candidatus Zixiibacteriota bacterium]|nr:MAG: hypothetical protein DRP47_05985 [candidate division Zixibacteria bacterium]